MIGYNETSDLTSYATARGITLISDPSILLTKALDWLELRPFKGEKTDEDQTLEFPRDGETTVPEKIKTAQLVAAVIYDQGGDPMKPIGKRVLSQSVDGAVSRTFSDKGPDNPIYVQLNDLLRGFLVGGGGANQISVVRA